MFSFGTPCLKWKLLQAIKYQYGFPGFAPPYHTRYLSMLATVTAGFTGAPSLLRTAQQLFTVDRITGSSTPTSANDNALGYLPVFPYGQSLTADPNTTYSVTGDAAYTYTSIGGPAPPLGNVFTTVSVQLSNQYTLDQLEDDGDALLATIDPSKMAWNTLKTVSFDIYAGFEPNRIPAQYQYGSSGGAIPALKAAAWNWLSLGDVSSVNYFPNVCAKLISYIAMAGNYCQTTLTFDYANIQINQSCQSGVGSCGAPFEVTPPSLGVGENSIVLIAPNCRCP